MVCLSWGWMVDENEEPGGSLGFVLWRL